MGWFDCDWYPGERRNEVFDSNGNAGPTAWCNGRVVGGWYRDADARVQLQLLEKPGQGARRALQQLAEELTAWLDGVRTSPKFPSRWMTARAACCPTAAPGAAGLTARSPCTAAVKQRGRLGFWHLPTGTPRMRSTARNRCGRCMSASLNRRQPVPPFTSRFVRSGARRCPTPTLSRRLIPQRNPRSRWGRSRGLQKRAANVSRRLFGTTARKMDNGSSPGGSEDTTRIDPGEVACDQYRNPAPNRLTPRLVGSGRSQRSGKHDGPTHVFCCGLKSQR